MYSMVTVHGNMGFTFGVHAINDLGSIGPCELVENLTLSSTRLGKSNVSAYSPIEERKERCFC